MSTGRVYQTVGGAGLNHDLPVMGLWRKAKRFGIWDPAAIDMTSDRGDWLRLDDLEREVLLHLTTLFQAGEEAVTLDLLPLLLVIAEEGRLEEEMYLTSFLWEEAKHVELFRRFLDEVAVERGDLTSFMGPAYREVFYQALPEALARLRHDASPTAQAAASVTYNMIVEGVLAETGYHAYHEILERNGILSGMQEGVAHLKNDEARHIAYGVFLLSRLVAENGEEVWSEIERRMGELLPRAISVVVEMFEAYEVLPFGLVMDDFIQFATTQFQRRIERVEKARGKTLAEVLRLAPDEFGTPSP